MSDEQYYDDEGEVIEPYDEDEIYIAEDELCDCWKHHFSHCYQIGCFGDLSSRRYWDEDDEDDEEDEDTDESDDGDEREWDTPSSDLSDIPF